MEIFMVVIFVNRIFAQSRAQTNILITFTCTRYCCISHVYEEATFTKVTFINNELYTYVAFIKYCLQKSRL